MGEIVVEIGQEDVARFLQLQRVTFIKVDGKKLEDLEEVDETTAWYLWKYLLVLTLQRQLTSSDKEQADGVEVLTHAQQVVRETAWNLLVEATSNKSKYIELYAKYSK